MASLNYSTIKNDVFFLSSGDNFNELNFRTRKINTATIHKEDVKPLVKEELDENVCVEPAQGCILPHLMHGKYSVKVLTDYNLASCSYTEDVSNEVPVTFSAQESAYVSSNFLSMDHMSSNKICKKVISVSNYSNTDYVLHSDSGLDYSNVDVRQPDMFSFKKKSSLKIKNTSPKSPKKTSKLQKISTIDFKNQLKDTSDIVNPLILLPHSKQLLEISSWNFSKSLANPQRPVSQLIQKHFIRNCVSNDELNEIDCSELQLMPLGYKPEIDLSTIKRIIRKRKNPYLFQEPTPSTDVKEPAISPVIVSNKLCEETPAEYVKCLLSDETEHDKCYFFEADIRDSAEIIVIHEGQETAENTAYTQQNIDVLLAAAAKNHSKSIVIRQQPDVVQNGTGNSFFKGNRQQLINC